MNNHHFKVAMLTPSISRCGGGLLDASRRLAQELHRLIGDRLLVVGLEDRYAQDDLASWAPVRPVVCSVSGPRAFGYAPAMQDVLKQFQPDLLHTVGLWMYPSQVARYWTRRHGVPHLVSPHGMLDPWALANSRWKKRLAGLLYEQAHLRSAACLHVLCEAEAQAVRQRRLGVPLEIIPNGVDLPGDRPLEMASLPAWVVARKAEGKNILLYLGRLHPKKGLSALVRGWADLHREEATPPGWALVVAGWDQHGYEQELKRRVQDARVPSDSVWFAGPQYGEAKETLFRCASAFILPSLSEGLPMVVLEAWAHRLPVVMTAACNLEEGFQVGAALQAKTDADPLSRTLRQLFQMSEPERQAMGLAGYELVARKFQWRWVAERMRGLYEHILDDPGRRQAES